MVIPPSWRDNYDYVAGKRSMISPCPSRDHHDELERLLMAFEPEPTDSNAAEALIDPAYTAGLVRGDHRPDLAGALFAPQGSPERDGRSPARGAFG